MFKKEGLLVLTCHAVAGLFMLAVVIIASNFPTVTASTLECKVGNATGDTNFASSVDCDSVSTNLIKCAVANHYPHNKHIRQRVIGYEVAPLRFPKCPMCGVTADETGDAEGGGIVVCFGCREVYWREPIRAVWHVQFCPRCCKNGDKRWNDEIKDSKGEVLPLSGSRHMWEHFKMTLQKDVEHDGRWIAGAGCGK